MLLAVRRGVYMEHLVSLESAQEARVAFGFLLEQLSCFFLALQTSRVHRNLQTTQKHGWQS